MPGAQTIRDNKYWAVNGFATRSDFPSRAHFPGLPAPWPCSHVGGDTDRDCNPSLRSPVTVQAAGGHGPERKERLDWMYEGPMQSAADKEAEANEYLLGKEVRGVRLGEDVHGATTASHET